MNLTLIRHATLLVEMGQARLLIDPMLDPAGTQPPLPETANQLPNPLVELPIAAEQLVDGLDAVIVSHLHPDHFDATAMRSLPRDVPVICQPHEAPTLAGLGLGATPLADPFALGELRVSPTAGRHGRGQMAEAMGPVMGVVLAAPREPTLYLAGDSVWCEQTAAAIDAHHPDVIVVNAGAPQFTHGGSITMDAADVVSTAEVAPAGTVIAVHMEAYNHCGLTRAALAEACERAGCADRVLIPADGETIEIDLPR
ncbi:MAG: MBL fold metallo-hydrolase [Thermoleophilia bacterium]|nr:MBL fold metallo-hydrolase [Thermoleophilia bacterium]MDH3724463.1 MBL fold metallo-hydrolase [Thermoleophilia bacterium]